MIAHFKLLIPWTETNSIHKNKPPSISLVSLKWVSGIKKTLLNQHKDMGSFLWCVSTCVARNIGWGFGFGGASMCPGLFTHATGSVTCILGSTSTLLGTLIMVRT